MQTCLWYYDSGNVPKAYWANIVGPGLVDVKLNVDGTKVYIAVHVNDFGIAAGNKSFMKEAAARIKDIYQCVEGDLDFYLGVQVVRDRDIFRRFASRIQYY